MENEKFKVKWTGYIALAAIILFFSGIFQDIDPEGPFRWLLAFDFNTILGSFGSLGTVGEGYGITLASDFRGSGGSGARDGFVFALTLVPAVMLALGAVKMAEHLDGLNAAAKLLSPVLRPLMGIPGITGLGIIGSLQSADAGAAMTKQLHDDKKINNKERMIFVAFQMTAGGTLTNFFGSGPALFPALAEAGVGIGVIISVIFVFKIIGGNLMRLYVKKFVKELN